MPFERIARFNRAKNIQETKPLESEITTKTNNTERKKRVEFAALVDYDRLPPPPQDQTGFKLFKDSSIAITKWLSKKTIKTSKWIKKYLNFGQVINISAKYSQN